MEGSAKTQNHKGYNGSHLAIKLTMKFSAKKRSHLADCRELYSKKLRAWRNTSGPISCKFCDLSSYPHLQSMNLSFLPDKQNETSDILACYKSISITLLIKIIHLCRTSSHSISVTQFTSDV